MLDKLLHHHRLVQLELMDMAVEMVMAMAMEIIPAAGISRIMATLILTALFMEMEATMYMLILEGISYVKDF